MQNFMPGLNGVLHRKQVRNDAPACAKTLAPHVPQY
jgi:hypothetical protein